MPDSNLNTRTQEHQNTTLKIGILGCRGIPNRYGCYEQFAQFLAQGLVQRGHQVWVYQSSLHPYRESSWEGVRLIRQYDPENKLGPFGQFIYDYRCLQDAAGRDFDVLLQLGYTSSAVFFLLWPKRAVNVIHMDGLEWKRSKYRRPVRWFLKKMEGIAARQGDVLIADSREIQSYLLQRYRKPSVFIPYGATIPTDFAADELEKYALQAGKYFLLIARLVPENNIQTIIEGYLQSRSALPLVIVGSTETNFGRRLRGNYSPAQIRWLGSIFDLPGLNNLRHFATLYFHGHSVGGTNPSLLEAIACSVPVCAHDNPFNRSVLGDHAFYFQTSTDVARTIEQCRQGAPTMAWIAANLETIRTQYAWEQIIGQYEAGFRRTANWTADGGRQTADGC